MKHATSAIPPGTFYLKDLPTGPREVTLRLTNHSKRVFVAKLVDLGLLGMVAQIEAARKEDESTAELARRVGARFSIEAQGNQMAAMLYAMTRYDHPELDFRDCQAAVPYDPDELREFSTALMEVYGRAMPEAKPKAVDEPNPTKPAKKPASRSRNGGKRSSAN